MSQYEEKYVVRVTFRDGEEHTYGYSSEHAAWAASDGFSEAAHVKRWEVVRETRVILGQGCKA